MVRTPLYLEGMPDVFEMRRAVRVLLLDVMDQCARHVDACPEGRDRFEQIARDAHDYLARFESRSQSSSLGGLSQKGLYLKAQDRVLDWLLELQEVRRAHLLSASLEHLPTWTGNMTNDAVGQTGTL